MDIMEDIYTKITSNPEYCFKIQNKKINEITLQDVKNFLGIGLQMCIAPNTTIKDYWSTGKLNFMKRYINRFCKISKKVINLLKSLEFQETNGKVSIH
jgi:hypothetical protein